MIRRIKTDEEIEAEERLAKRRAQLGTYIGSLDWLKGRIRANPMNASNYGSAAVLMEELGRKEEAEKYLQRAKKLQPADTSVRNDIAVGLMKEGKIDEAIEELRQAIIITGGSSLLHKNMAAALSRKGRIEESITHCRLALDLDPHDPMTLRNLARLQDRRGDARTGLDTNIRALASAERLGSDFTVGTLAGSVSSSSSSSRMAGYGSAAMSQRMTGHADAHRSVAVLLVGQEDKTLSKLGASPHQYMDSHRILAGKKYSTPTTAGTEELCIKLRLKMQMARQQTKTMSKGDD